MRKMSRVLAILPWLTLATACLPNGAGTNDCTSQSDGGSRQQDVDYVEIVRLDAASTLFKAQLVSVSKGEIMLVASGKGTQLQDFQKQSAAMAARERTVVMTLPLTETADVVVRPPMPPGPTGQERIWIDFATQVGNAYGSVVAQLPTQQQPAP